MAAASANKGPGREGSTKELLVECLLSNNQCKCAGACPDRTSAGDFVPRNQPQTAYQTDRRHINEVTLPKPLNRSLAVVILNLMARKPPSTHTFM